MHLSVPLFSIFLLVGISTFDEQFLVSDSSSLHSGEVCNENSCAAYRFVTRITRAIYSQSEYYINKGISEGFEFKPCKGPVYSRNDVVSHIFSLPKQSRVLILIGSTPRLEGHDMLVFTADVIGLTRNSFFARFLYNKTTYQAINGTMLRC